MHTNQEQDNPQLGSGSVQPKSCDLTSLSEVSGHIRSEGLVIYSKRNCQLERGPLTHSAKSTMNTASDFDKLKNS